MKQKLSTNKKRVKITSKKISSKGKTLISVLILKHGGKAKRRSQQQKRGIGETNLPLRE